MFNCTVRPSLPASSVPLKWLQGFVVSSIAHIYLASRFTFGQVSAPPSLSRTNELISCQIAPSGRCLRPSLRIRSSLPRWTIPFDVLRVFSRRMWPGAPQCANKCVYLEDAEPARDGARTCLIWYVLPLAPSPLEFNYTMLGYIGTGALISPLVSTQFAQIERWYFHYLFLLGATMITLSVMVIFFRGKSAEGISLLLFSYVNGQY